MAALAVPQALGYASIAGAPVEVGLYAVPVALVAYGIFGSSRQLVAGPVSTVSALSGSLLASSGVAGTARAASYTAALALGAGLVLITAGLLGVGWVAEFLSKPIVSGFVLGLTVLSFCRRAAGVAIPTVAGVDFTISALAVERVADLRRDAPPTLPERRPARWTPLLRHLLRRGSRASQGNPTPSMSPGPLTAPGSASA